MKYIQILILTLFAFSCSQKKQPSNLIPGDYFLPEDQIGAGKTFIYVNKVLKDTTFVDMLLETSGDNSIVIQCSKNHGFLTDSMILRNQKLLEYYINPSYNGNLWKAQKISDTVLKLKSTSLAQISSVFWQKDTAYISASTRTEILKDTIFTWQGKSYPTVITKAILRTSSNYLHTSSGKYESEMEIIQYHCKKIGVVKRVLTSSWIAEPIVHDLVEIREFKKYN